MAKVIAHIKDGVVINKSVWSEDSEVVQSQDEHLLDVTKHPDKPEIGHKYDHESGKFTDPQEKTLEDLKSVILSRPFDYSKVTPLLFAEALITVASRQGDSSVTIPKVGTLSIEDAQEHLKKVYEEIKTYLSEQSRFEYEVETATKLEELRALLK